MSCNAKKDPNGTWRIQYRWTDWTGAKKKSQKRGFKTKKEAEEWYAHFLLQQSSDPTMTLADFWEIYKADMEKRLRKTTMKQKEYVMNDKVLPYFGKTPINEITAPMIRKWQGEMMEKGFKPTYLKTIHNQLSAILNYAVNFYELRSNPCRKAGSMGKSRADERPYWTLEEFQKFSDAIMDKQDSWVAFQILFWTGMRLGELLALQVKDVNFEEGTITVDESLARIDGEDLITAPKTESSIRVITIHKELQKAIKEYIATLYRARAGTRLFAGRTKSFFEHEMERGIKLSGVKKITVHCTSASTAHMAPSPAGTVFCIRIPRFLTSLTACIPVIPPAAVIAAYSPRESPAVRSAETPLFFSSPVMARQVVTSAAWVYSVRSSLSFFSKQSFLISSPSVSEASSNTSLARALFS